MRKLTEKLLSFLISLFPLKKLKLPLSLCVDVTYRCNLECKHCYFRSNGYKNELSDKEWVKKLKGLRSKYKPIICSWVGGEPMLRRELIERGRKMFPFNWVITNGTMEIPDWKDTIFLVSVDGTKKYHEQLRGKGTYEKIKKKILDSKGKIFLNMVITRKNHLCLEDFVKEWRETNIKGISMYFYSPIKNSKDNNDFFIKSRERDDVIRRIMKLKRKYKEFILMPENVLKMMTSDNYRKFIGDACIVKKSTICLDAEGNVKKPCLFKGIKCKECGCSMPFGIKSFLDGDRESIKSGIILTNKIGIKSLNLLKHI